MAVDGADDRGSSTRDGNGFKTGQSPNLDSYQLSASALTERQSALNSLGDVTGDPTRSPDGIYDYCRSRTLDLKTMHFLANWEE